MEKYFLWNFIQKHKTFVNSIQLVLFVGCSE